MIKEGKNIVATAKVDKISLEDYEANVKVSKEGNLYVESEDLLSDPAVREEIEWFANVQVEKPSEGRR